MWVVAGWLVGGGGGEGGRGTALHKNVCASGQIAQISEFYISNMNVEEIVSREQYVLLNTTLWGVYPVQGDSLPLVLALIDPRDRDIEVPEPPTKIG